MANTRFTQFFSTKHFAPVLVDCNFVIDVANGNGLGIRNLKGPGVQAVFANSSAAFTGTSHTSTLIDGISGGTSSLLVGMPVQGSGIVAGSTIASIVDSGSITLSVATSSSTTGSITYQGVGSPNPAAGYFMVQLKDNYNRYYGGFSGFVTKVSGTPILVASAGVTINTTYVIVLVGTTTAAGWQSLGLPVGIIPAVGVSFVATATATATGSGVVEVPDANGSKVGNMEVVGDPNTTIVSVGSGSKPPYIIVRTMGPTDADTTTPIAKAPVDNSVLGMSIYLSNSSVIVAGE